MATRRGNGAVATAGATLPWWVGVLVGLVFFFCLYGWVPTLLVGGRHAAVFTLVFQVLAWLALVSCASLGLFPTPTALVSAGTQLMVVPQPAPRQAPQGPGLPVLGGPHTVFHWIRPAPVLPASGWTIKALRSLEWKRFELVLVRYYASVGVKATTLRTRRDGGIDVMLTKPGTSQAPAVLRCKAWTGRSPAVEQLQDLLALMAENRAGSAYFVTTGVYSKEALAFGATHGLQLLDGFDMLAHILALPAAQQHALLRYAFTGDFSTPSCPSCGAKMQRHTNKRGPFWACAQRPQCQTAFALRTPVALQ